MNNGEKMLTTADIMKLTTIGRTKLHEMQKTGEFPKADEQKNLSRIQGKRSPGTKHWKTSTVYNWMQRKAAERK